MGLKHAVSQHIFYRAQLQNSVEPAMRQSVKWVMLEVLRIAGRIQSFSDCATMSAVTAAELLGDPDMDWEALKAAAGRKCADLSQSRV